MKPSCWGNSGLGRARRYSPFYNPGGPGKDSTPGVRYSSLGPAQLQPVWKRLDAPMTVTFMRGS